MVRLGGLPAAAFALLLLVGQSAFAAEAEGAFLIEGSALFPPSSRFEFAPLVAFANDTRGLSAFSLTAPSIVVHAYEREATQVTTPVPLQNQGDIRHVQHVLRDARIRLHEDGDAAGYLGLYPGPSATVAFTSAGAPLVERRERTEVTTNHGRATQEAFSTAEDYVRTVDEPHLYWQEAGALTYLGDGLVKAVGPDLRIEAGGLNRTFATGYETTSDGIVRTLVLRWVVLELHDATLEAESGMGWTLAARSSALGWDGRAYFEEVSGEAATSSARYAARAQTFSLEGAFEGRLSIPPVDERSVGALLLAVQGDLRSTDLAAQSIPVSTRIARSPFFDAPLFLALGFAVCLAGGGYAAGAWRGSRRTHPAPPPEPPAPEAPPGAPAHHLPFTAEDCCDAGAKAASEEDWAGAAKWFGRAHKLAPTSARICADLAFSLTQIGDLDQALVLYAQASHLSEDGEADFNAALATLHADRPLDEVETWLERALVRSPALVLTLDGDNDFRALEGRPRYEKAVQGAWDAMERAEGA